MGNGQPRLGRTRMLPLDDYDFGWNAMTDIPRSVIATPNQSQVDGRMPST